MTSGVLATIGTIAVALFILNAYTGGEVEQGIKSYCFSPETKWVEKRESSYCFLGQVLYEPSYEKEILGQTVRIPRWELGDIFIAIFLTTVTMLVLNMIRTGHSIGVPKMILIFIAALIAIKLLGWLLIQAAGPDCITFHDRIGGSYADALETACAAGAIAAVWKLLKMRRGI